MTTDEIYIKRCLQLALNGLGTTYPNPLVGSVIVGDDGKILGEGFHLKSGQPHAEVNAIADAENNGTADFSKATIYVNLEPCSHQGRTPPCADLIIKKGFKKVAIGTLDPHEKVAGRGVELLRAAGIDVTIGILEAECNALNKRFFTFHQQKRPFVILKWGETADGFLAPTTKDSKKPFWITNSYSRQRVHQMRAQEQSILVGAQTVLEDNPRLTVRDWHGENPIRIVLDYRNDLPEDAAVFDDQAVSHVLHRSHTDTGLILEDLYQLGIQSVIVEGGARTFQAFIDQSAWDEIHQFMAPAMYLKDGLRAPAIPKTASLKNRTEIHSDIYKIFVKS